MPVPEPSFPAVPDCMTVPGEADNNNKLVYLRWVLALGSLF